MHRYIRRNTPALFIFNDVVPYQALAARSKKTNKVVGVTPASLQFHFSFERARIDRWAKAAAAACGVMIFVSSKGLDEWAAFPALARKEMCVIPNSYREDEVRNLLRQDKRVTRENLGIGLRQFVLVCVASVQPRKGQDLLINALPELIKSIPQLKLYLVGPERPENWMSALRNCVADDGLAERVNLMGLRSDALDFIHTADVFILPSRAEVQGIAILVAMALKTPVVAADVSGIPEMIQHGANGLLFPIDDVQKLTECIRRLYDDTSLGRVFAERASHPYWQSFSRRRQLGLYRETVAKCWPGEVVHSSIAPSSIVPRWFSRGAKLCN